MLIFARIRVDNAAKTERVFKAFQSDSHFFQFLTSPVVSKDSPNRSNT